VLPPLQPAWDAAFGRAQRFSTAWLRTLDVGSCQSAWLPYPFGGRDGYNGQMEPIALRVQYKRLNSFFADYAKNIHRGRTFIATDRLLEVGTDFRFELEVPGLSEQLVLQGKVQWLVTGQQGAQSTGMGIGFVFHDEAHRERVQSIVAKLMTDSLGPRLYAQLVRAPLVGADATEAHEQPSPVV
jgi:type IV pilus assembly protein PilZ